jgi:allantoate deiminase
MPRAQLELHIEQGPVLESAGEAIGIVANIAGYRRLRATLTGAPRHSGTTPLAARRDALAGAAEVILAAETLARTSGEPARVSCGRVLAAPGLYNVVAGHSELALEVRHETAAKLAALEQALLEACASIAARRGLEFAHERVAEQAPTALSPALVASAQVLAQELGLKHRVMTSGAAHDTMELARVGISALMIFVPSRDGISHSPEEYTSAEQLDAGVRFASRLLAGIATDGAA